MSASQRDRIRVDVQGLKAAACIEAASRAEMTLDGYVAGLVAKVHVLTECARLGEPLAELTAACAELSSQRRAIYLSIAASS